MRPPLPLMIITALAVAPVARVSAQQAPTPTAEARAATLQPHTAQPATARSGAAAQPAAVAASEHKEAQSAPGSLARHLHPRHAADGAHGRAPLAASRGVLNLGATDITGNKELPKVMVIVPWKGSLGASGVIKPTDSLLDEVLQPVDRSVFQRRIRYYGQLNAAARQPAAGRVAPVGDTH